MPDQTAVKAGNNIEELIVEAELVLEVVDTKKDLKEKRKILKQTLYDGSGKLKHVVPKGIHL